MNQPCPNRCILLAAALSLQPFLVPAAAQQDRRPGSFRSDWRVAEEPAALDEREGAIQLSLEDAVALAIGRNLGLRVERYRRAETYFGIQRSLGIYDLNLLSTGFSTEETSPAASNLTGAQVFESEAQGLDLQLDQLLPVGGTVSLDWDNSRGENNSLFSSVNPSFGIDFDFLYSQPLLRDFGKLATERNLRVARVNSAIGFSQLEGAVIGTVDEIENAYWTLVESRQQLRVAEESLALAEELHGMNEIQVEVGTLAPLELIQSEVGIAIRQEEIIRARAAVEDAGDLIRRLLNVEDPRLWEMEVVPSTDPEVARITIDLGAAMETALAERPEMVQQRLQIETLEIDSKFFANQKKPRLDVQARYGFNGLGGDVVTRENPFDPESPSTVLPGGYSDALDQIIDAEFEGWQVGLNFAYPLQNRFARAQSTIADLALEQGRTQLDDVEIQIRTGVRTAARGVSTAAQQIDSARVSMRLAEENLDAERKRYENGLSTSFQVLEIQEDLTQARSRLVTATTGYRRALVRYYRSIGRLLEENGIELVDDIEAELAEEEENGS